MSSHKHHGQMSTECRLSWRQAGRTISAVVASRQDAMALAKEMSRLGGYSNIQVEERKVSAWAPLSECTQPDLGQVPPNRDTEAWRA